MLIIFAEVRETAEDSGAEREGELNVYYFKQNFKRITTAKNATATIKNKRLKNET